MHLFDVGNFEISPWLTSPLSQSVDLKSLLIVQCYINYNETRTDFGCFTYLGGTPSFQFAVAHEHIQVHKIHIQIKRRVCGPLDHSVLPYRADDAFN